MRLLASGYTDTGRVRSNNEDCFEADDRLSLYLVADGMGGHAAGEVASATAVSTVAEEVNRQWSLGRGDGQEAMDASRAEQILVSAFRKANRTIHEAAAADRSRHGMGTTLTAAWCVEDCLVVSHVGDSRAYLVRDFGLQRLTQDHHLTAELPGMDDEMARAPLANVLTRALGIRPDVEVDTNRVLLRGGDRILLCSDGLYSEVSDEGILSIVHAAGGPSQASRELAGTANRLGGRDNITALVVCVFSGLLPYWTRRLLQHISNRNRSA